MDDLIKNKIFLYLRTDLGTQHLQAGGSVTHTLGVINGLLKAGCSVVCASSAMHSLLSPRTDISCTLLSLPRWVTITGFKISCLLSNIFFTLSIMRLLRTQQFDYVYQRYSMLNVSGVLVRWWQGIPLILEFNGSEVFSDAYWAPKRTLKLTWLVRAIERINLEHADYIVVVSQVLKDSLLQHNIPASKIIVNPNGVDPNIFDPEHVQYEADVVRTQLGLHNRFVCGFIGTFGAWHGIGLLADIIPLVQQHYPQVHFLLIGDGPLLPMIKEKKLQNVTCVGTIPYEHAPRYIAACDVLLSPTQPNADGSQFFGSPTKLFEYMSMAKPVIVSDVGQLSEIVDEQCGILVAPTDRDGFIDAVRVLFELDVHERMQLGMHARQKVITTYTWDCHVRTILRVLQNEA